MPSYEVHYAFTCPRCLKKERGHIVVMADDKEDARYLAVVSAACPACGSKITSSQFVSTGVVEIEPPKESG